MKTILVLILLYCNILTVRTKYRLILGDSNYISSDELPAGADANSTEVEGRLGLPGFMPVVNNFDHCIQPPAICPNENITFWFYTRSTQDSPVQIDIINPQSLRNLRYGREDPWKLIIHGYTGWKDYSPNTEIRPAYFAYGEYNIISVDYNPLVKEPCYMQAANNVPLVGNCTAQMIDTLVEYGIFKLEELHVIGFSLGGQVTGQIGLFLKSGKLERISGLDPALPLFVGSASIKLDETDAKFVDVIHTDAGNKGKWERCGHIDFYPNGGYSQLGCDETSEYGGLQSCNHARAAVYFAESIASPVGFWGTPCNSYVTFFWGWCDAPPEDLVIMGEYTPRNSSGTYYLETNPEPPYALGKKPRRDSEYRRAHLRRLNRH